MQHPMWLALTLLLVAAALAGLVIARRLRPKPAPCHPQQYDAMLFNSRLLADHFYR